MKNIALLQLSVVNTTTLVGIKNCSSGGGGGGGAQTAAPTAAAFTDSWAVPACLLLLLLLGAFRKYIVKRYVSCDVLCT